MKDKLNATEVCVLVGCSVQTLNYWYRFKKENPRNAYAKMLPNFIQEGGRQTRYWKEEDIFKLVNFKNSIPRGRNGILGDITQKYLKQKEK